MKDDFQIYVPFRLWKASKGDPAKRMRIAGIVSTDNVDRQGETLLQRGLDFSEFMEHGWFNDNHSQKTCDVLGEPEEVQFYEKGATLPDGSVAKANLHWCEGFLYPDYEPAQKIWRLAESLKSAGSRRSLGFSVEGKIRQRRGSNRKIVAKALVRNIAITANPVNTDTKLAALAKSLRAAESESSPWDITKSLMDQFGEPTVSEEGLYMWKAQGAEIEIRYDKALTVGTPAPGETPEGPRTGEGAGAILTPESLEREQHNTTYRKSLEYVQQKLGIDETTAGRVLELALAVEEHARR